MCIRDRPHPHFDYEKKVFTKDGREEYMEELKALDAQHMRENATKRLHNDIKKSK